MRPVDKGACGTNFKKYQDAQSQLIQRIGDYCSYCERRFSSGIHDEHKVPKSKNGSQKLLWSNFLLSCPNCNSAKGSRSIALSQYIWPDKDNTMRAFNYDAQGLICPSDIKDKKIIRTWKLLGLNRHPDKFTRGIEPPTVKDRRWLERQTSVFSKDSDMRKRFIEKFPGTAKNCFDAGANLVQRSGGYL
jgi:uncharacterized protein (TIGR02646 family)